METGSRISRPQMVIAGITGVPTGQQRPRSAVSQNNRRARQPDPDPFLWAKAAMTSEATIPVARVPATPINA